MLPQLGDRLGKSEPWLLGVTERSKQTLLDPSRGGCAPAAWAPRVPEADLCNRAWWLCSGPWWQPLGSELCLV